MRVYGAVKYDSYGSYGKASQYPGRERTRARQLLLQLLLDEQAKRVSLAPRTPTAAEIWEARDAAERAAEENAWKQAEQKE